ncbi:NUDIX domain-containing protein [Nonomuraea jabiensis]|uniref:NUDIX domain-containing protein n=1 Tax=Nonomuraea jabiensis TaxID=882448 RepID=UPI0036C82155
MPDRTIRDKALCYIVRNDELLVFRHVDYSPEEVGVQVPAGSIKEGEDPRDAALREAREETGLRIDGRAARTMTGTSRPRDWSASGSRSSTATCSSPARARSSTACSSATPDNRVSEMRDPRRRTRRPAA